MLIEKYKEYLGSRRIRLPHEHFEVIKIRYYPGMFFKLDTKKLLQDPIIKNQQQKVLTAKIYYMLL